MGCVLAVKLDDTLLDGDVVVVVLDVVVVIDEVLRGEC